MTSYDTEFVEFKEEKVPSNKAGERFFLKFYLITTNGNRVLAATAEDQGDAHYCYKNSRGFNQYGILDSHSRKDVIMWLEKIIHESSLKFKSASAAAERMILKTPDHPEGVYFVGEEQKYSTFPDGRRCTEWYLLDNHGVAHRAVIGEENHARDGHYVYRSVEPFSLQRQLECRNKAGVYHWLELWIVHEDGLSKEKQKERQRRSRPKRRPIVLDVGGSSSRKYRKGLISFRSPVRTKVPSVHPEVFRAQEVAREKEKLMLEAMNFCFTKATECEVECMQHWQKILDEMKSQWDRGNVFSHMTEESIKDEKLVNSETGFVYLRRNFYGLCLEAFREIGTMFVSLDLLDKTGVPRLIAAFGRYPAPDIAQYSMHICRKWTAEIAKHRQSMTSPEMLVDPLDAVGHLLK